MKISMQLFPAPTRLWRYVGCAALLGAPLLAQAQAPYAQPEAAADALIAAMAADDKVAVGKVLGRGWKVFFPDDAQVGEDRRAFLDMARQSRAVRVADGRGVLVVGADAWPLPIPLAQGKDGQWRFDPVAGREAMLERAIGANERAIMQAVLAFVDAQREYALADRNGDGILEYAQRFNSQPGKRDGLIWSTSLGDESPLGESYLDGAKGRGYHGYSGKILLGQGAAAAGGARSYVIGKRLMNGYALLVWPLNYGKTGVMSFMVNQDGVVYERDMGPQSGKLAKGIKSFNPDEGWRKVEP
jgi:hypothetical protein